MQRVLRSLNGVQWKPGEALTATCTKTEHAAPSSNCSCGIYASSLEHEHLKAATYTTVDFVAGRIALWGKVIQHERGFRAEHAYPLELIVVSYEGDPQATESLARELGAYGVPVRIQLIPAHHRPRRARQPAIAQPRNCEACGTPLANGDCTNPDHDWAAHRTWKDQMKREGSWTLMNRIDDLIDPPPRRGQTQEDADRSLRNRAIRGVTFTFLFVLMIATNVMCVALETRAN